VFLVAGGGESGANATPAQRVEQLGYLGEDPEVNPLCDLQKLLLLRLPELVAVLFLQLFTEDGGNQEISALPDFDADALRRNVEPEPLERAMPCLDVRRVGVYQSSVHIEDHALQGHGEEGMR
jgi:hypothetical protein